MSAISPKNVDGKEAKKNVDMLFAEFVVALDNCLTDEELKKVWEIMVLPQSEYMLPSDYDRFCQAYNDTYWIISTKRNKIIVDDK